MKLRYTILSLFLLLLFTVSAQQYTLEECVETALNNNRNVKQQMLNKQQREIAYSQAKSDLLPNLNASAGQSFVFGRSIGLDNVYENTNSSQTSFGINAGITLFDGLRMKYNIDARRAEVSASDADLEKFKDDIEMSVSTAFLQVLLQKELLQIAIQQIDLTKANIGVQSQLIESGKLAKGEKYELEAQLAREEQNLVQAESQLKLAILDLAQIMELDDFSNFDVIAPPIESIINKEQLVSSYDIIQSALLVRPEIDAANRRHEISLLDVKIARSRLYPTLTFGANIGTGYYNMGGRTNAPFGQQLKNNMSNSLGFSMQVPIFNKFQTRNSIRSAKIAAENSRLEIDKVKIDLRKRVEQAFENAKGAKSKWQATQKAETAGQESYRFTQEKYDGGRANSFELFQSKTNLAKTLADQAQAKYEYAFRLKILELLKN